MICPKCGAELPDTAELCWSCRMKFISSEKAEVIAKKRLLFKKIIVSTSALVILGVLIFVIIKSLPPNFTFESFLNVEEVSNALGDPNANVESRDCWDKKANFYGVKIDHMFIDDWSSICTTYALIFTADKSDKIASIVNNKAHLQNENLGTYYYGDEELRIHFSNIPLKSDSKVNSWPIGEEYTGYYILTISKSK